MADKVWLLECGSCSDYQVVGVFTSREKAEMAMEWRGEDANGPRVREEDLDPYIEEVAAGLDQWYVLLHAETGEVEMAEPMVEELAPLEGCGLPQRLARRLRLGSRP